MIKKTAYIFSAIVALICLLPVYFRTSIGIEAQVSAPDSTRVWIYYKSGPDSKYVRANIFMIEKKRTLRLSLDEKEISGVKIGFTRTLPEKAGIQSLKIITDEVHTVYPSSTEKFAPNRKRNIAYVYDDFSPIRGKKTFRFLSFLLCLGCVGIGPALINRYKTAGLLFAATAGYIGLSLNCDLSFSRENAFFGMIVFSFLFFFYKHYFFDRPFSPLVFVSGFVLAALNILSTRLYLSGSFSFIRREAFLVLSGIVGEAVFFHAAFDFVSRLFSERGVFKEIRVKEKFRAYTEYYERKTVLCSFIVICALWLPFFLFYYPGIFPFDAQNTGNLSDQFLSAQTNVLFAVLFKIGNALLNAGFGCGLYTLFVSFVSAYVFALCMNTIKSLGFNLYGQAACLFFFSVYPFGGYMPLWASGHLLYAAAVLFFVLQLFSLMVSGQKSAPLNYPFLRYFLSGLAVCSFGWDGVFIMSVSATGMLVCSKAALAVKKRTALLSLISLAVFGISGMFLPAARQEYAAPDKTAVKTMRSEVRTKAAYVAFIPVFDVEPKRPAGFQPYMQHPEYARPVRNFINAFYKDKMASSLLYTGVRPPLYVWLMIMLGLYVMTVKRPECLSFLFPALGGTAACVLFSKGGGLPDFLPVIMMTPLVFSFCLADVFDARKQEEEK